MFEQSYGSVSEKFTELGAESNAFTDSGKTVYYFRTAENFEQCLKLLLDFVQKPYFRNNELETEKKIIASEIKMYADDPAWQSYRCEDRVGFSFGICVTGNDTEETKHRLVLSDFRVSNTEIYHTGGGLGLDWCDHKNCDGTESGPDKFRDVVFENLHLHHNNVPDVSLSSLFIQCVTNAVFRNSTIDVGAGGAPWGAAGIHLQLVRNVLIDRVTIKNMPHTGTNDECGIDFETDVDTCVILNSTFDNNAGAALEFLANQGGVMTPVSRNISIVNCVFRNNNWAKIYPNAGQIQIVNWDVDNRPTGVICGCAFENPEAVACVDGYGDLSGMIQLDNRDMNSAKWGMVYEKAACNV